MIPIIKKFYVRLSHIFSFKNIGSTNVSKNSAPVNHNIGAKASINSPTVYNNCIILAAEEFERIPKSNLQNNSLLTQLDTNRLKLLLWDCSKQSIDMDNDIKNIYKICYKICRDNVQNNQAYRVIKNLIDVVSKLTIEDIEYFKKLFSRLPEGYYSFPYNNYISPNPKIITLKNLGVLEIWTDHMATNQTITNTLRKMEDNIAGHGRARPLQINHENFIKTCITLTLEGKLLLEILKNQTDVLLLDDETVNNIIKFLNNEIKKVSDMLLYY